MTLVTITRSGEVSPIKYERAAFLTDVPGRFDNHSAAARGKKPPQKEILSKFHTCKKQANPISLAL